MTTRQVQLKPDAAIEPCPKCGNKVHFSIHSEQVAEDCCEVWARCQCGHEPPNDERLEDVWGGCNTNNCLAALAQWNESMRSLA